MKFTNPLLLVCYSIFFCFTYNRMYEHVRPSIVEVCAARKYVGGTMAALPVALRARWWLGIMVG